MLVLRAYGKVAPISTYIQGFLADNKEGTLIFYHSKRQITTLSAGMPQKVQV